MSATSSAADNGYANRIQDVSATFYPDTTFSSAVSAAFDQKSFREFLPPDVLIRCSDGGVCEAHRFVLVFQSEFFRARFRFSVGENKVEEVNLKGLKYATVDNVKTVLKILYQGQQSVKFICLGHVIPLLYLCNFLMLPTITEFCCRLLDIQMKQNPEDAAFIMRAYHIGEELNEKILSHVALTHLKALQEEPENFETVSVETMLLFLSSPESFGFCCLRSLPALKRERYLLNLTVKFIKHDEKGRVRAAADLFQRLRLPYIIRDLDLDSLGLSVLKSDKPLQQLLLTARMAASSKCLWETDFDLSTWLPRPGSIKYSFYSKRFGSFRLATKVAARSAAEAPNPSRHRRVVFERGQEHCLKGITVYPRDDGDGHCIIGGIKLRWSDGTEDHAGHYDESSKGNIDLNPYESMLVKVYGKGKYIEGLLFHNNECRYGPYGCSKDLLNQPRSFESTLGSLKAYEDFCYFDGLKCCEISRGRDGKDKVITAVQFKLSLMCNLPMEHLMPKNSLEANMQPTWGLDYLEQAKVVKSSDLKRAFKAASQFGYGKLGITLLLPNRA